VKLQREQDQHWQHNYKFLQLVENITLCTSSHSVKGQWFQAHPVFGLEPWTLAICRKKLPTKLFIGLQLFFFENPDLWIKTLACSTDLLHPFSIFEKIECGRPMRKRHVSEMTLKAGYLTQNPPVDQSEPAPTNAPTWMDSAWTCFIASSSMSIHPIFSIGFLFPS
jgi:hypothetical protein